MKRAQLVKSSEQIASGVGIVPVVAGVVDSHKVSGRLRQGSRRLDEIVARQEKLKDRFTKGLVFACQAVSRSNAAGMWCFAPLELGKERRQPFLISRRLGQILSVKERANRCRKLPAKVVAFHNLVHFLHGGVVR